MSEKQEEKTVSILVTRPAPFVIPRIYNWVDKMQNGQKVRVKGKMRFKAVVLKPGPNREVLTPSHWAAVEKQCAQYLKAGKNETEPVLKLIEADEKVPEQFDPNAQITKVNVDQAKVAIAEETDLERLKAWHETDERKTVREAIKARIEELAKAEANNQN